jgi:hypothetical protein
LFELKSIFFNPMGKSITITLRSTELHREITEVHRVWKSNLC